MASDPALASQMVLVHTNTRTRARNTTQCGRVRANNATNPKQSMKFSLSVKHKVPIKVAFSEYLSTKYCLQISRSKFCLIGRKTVFVEATFTPTHLGRKRDNQFK